MATQAQIDDFHRFASERLTNRGSEKSVDELYDEWRWENLTPEDVAEDVAAIQASLDDMKRGETGRDVDEFLRELCAKD